MAADWVNAGERRWKQEEPTWGIWAVPESNIAMLPNDMRNLHAIELGCGTGHVSGWMARRDATVTGINNFDAQLTVARHLMRENNTDLELLHGNAETVPKPDTSYDFAISEYGAAIWCDPMVWLPEAARLLKPGSKLRFLGHYPMAIACWGNGGADPDALLRRCYFDLHKLGWRDAEIDPGGVEFNLSISG
ncbi:MAG: SAM-dependent methyltransferase [Gammaproteobacteria bacterium]|nr:SAM-dependent methyltransferase [Gammaproteobacteria bacterium]RPG26710.1 MAG: class I SAM-dependent methyltransferase [Gammaproteobacteria bacterium TMED50]